jgi:HNH endonuclease
MSSGYISEALRDRVEAQAKFRCGYCRSQQKYVLGTLEIDHFIPRSKGGTDDEENLWLACSSCNVFKGVQTHAIDPLTRRRVRLFNLRYQKWSRHFVWVEDGTQIVGQTACGRATVMALRLNHPISVNVRKAWVSVGWHPPIDDE